MTRRTLQFITALILLSIDLPAQTVKDFFYVDKVEKELPVMVRGSLDNNTILLYVSGSYGDNAIDFGRSDYPGWENTLEKKTAIAYYDKRGLNKRVSRIDTAQINWNQNSRDIYKIADFLKNKYVAKIFLMGHSAGGMLVYEYLSTFNEQSNSIIEGAIILNTPFTNDSSPKRYSYYRPLFLKNIAQEYMEKAIDTSKWQTAYNWMVNTESINSRERSKIWNDYVESAFEPVNRKITLAMAVKVIFTKPYSPIKYLNNKDNDLIGDLLWEQKQNISDEEFSIKLSQINHRVLVITGRYDAIAIPEEMEPIRRLLKDTKVIVFPDCGHESYLDQPERLNEAILEFIY
jgi:pimeloyl-ACP methyl ester carboxylesterase